MLKLLSAVSHQHMITLLATYEKSGRFHLVFHWAESDLFTYWRDTAPTTNDQTIRWLAWQCAGIANGLLLIHNPHDRAKSLRITLSHRNSVANVLKVQQASQGAQSEPERLLEQPGHHGDIKAQNILLFRNQSSDSFTLKISDFGLAGFKSTGDVSTGNTPTYAAPEYVIHGGAPNITSCDIWALGCLYLEFLTWFLGGWDMLKAFQVNRVRADCKDTFYVTRHLEDAHRMSVEVKRSVVEVSISLLLK